MMTGAGLDPVPDTRIAGQKAGKESDMKNAVIRERYSTLEEAKQRAAHVDKVLRRKAATVSEIKGIDYSIKPEWTGDYNTWLDAMTVTKGFEVCFVTRSKKFRA